MAIASTGLAGLLPERGRCGVMGVINVTPDSFSDGGQFLDTASAVARGLTLRGEGADIVDVGGESTRPGAERVPPEEERRRVLPVVRELAAAGVAVSVDTMRADLAEDSIEAGARMVNDVSGGLADPHMAKVMAATGTPYVVMHWRGPSTDMQSRAHYGDVVADVVGELATRLDDLLGAGVAVEQLVIDPGLGFAKTAAHNWALLAHFDALLSLGRPVLVGASRKGFLGHLLADSMGRPRPMHEREAATAAVSLLAAEAGAWCVRVHEVRPTRDALAVAAAVAAAR